MLTRYSRSPQRRAAGDTDEFLLLACLTYRPSWRATPGEVADDERRHARARELLAAQPDLATENIYTAAGPATSPPYGPSWTPTRRSLIGRAVRTSGHRCCT
jgi:hypothetical protein